MGLPRGLRPLAMTLEKGIAEAVSDGLSMAMGGTDNPVVRVGKTHRARIRLSPFFLQGQERHPIATTGSHNSDRSAGPACSRPTAPAI